MGVFWFNFHWSYLFQVRFLQKTSSVSWEQRVACSVKALLAPEFQTSFTLTGSDYKEGRSKEGGKIAFSAHLQGLISGSFISY
jgi:hypothetical protein